MANEPEDLYPDNWHRFFAIENKILAWSLATQRSRTARETARMLDAAHSASLHWNLVCDALFSHAPSRNR